MIEPHFRALDRLGAELDRAIAREQQRRLPRLRTLGPLALTLTAALFVTGAAAAASYVLTGSPIPGALQRDVPRESTPLRGTDRLMGLDARDPGGGLPWDLRVSRSRTGQLCTAVGQVADDRLGIVGLDGRFRALPLLGYDTCGQDPGGTPALVGARVFDAPRLDDVRTVVSGVAGVGVTNVVVDGPGEPRSLKLGTGGTFLTVYAGYPEDIAPVIHFRGPDASERTIALAEIDRPRVADPENQAVWTVSTDERKAGGRAGQTCAQIRRERTREAAAFGLSYPVCGDLGQDPFFFEVAPLPRGKEIRQPRQPYPWGFATPRTMVWGAAREDVQRITIAGPAGRTPVDLSATGPGFIGAFPEGTRPADLTIEVTLASGETRRLVGGQNLRTASGALRPPEVLEPVRVPATRRAQDARSRLPWHVPVSATAQITRRHADPAGGAEWAVRTFDARVRESGQRLRCAQLGRIKGGGLLGPGGGRPLTLADPAAACVPVTDNPRREPVSRITTFVDDSDAYAPRPLHTVAWGTAGPTGARVDVVTPTGSQPVPLAVGGAFIAIFPPELTARDLTVRTTYEDGRHHSVERFRDRDNRVKPGSEQIVARAPDPDGGAPYGLLEWRTTAGRRCSYVDRVVGDTIGTLRDDTFAPYPVHDGGRCGVGTPSRSQPVFFSVSSAPGDGNPDSARIRRTLPGRTIISGSAHPNVRDITIQTPRDVRTLRPAGAGRSFLAVYDGLFFSGEITLTAHFDDGTTHRQTMRIGEP